MQSVLPAQARVKDKVLKTLARKEAERNLASAGPLAVPAGARVWLEVGANGRNWLADVEGRCPGLEDAFGSAVIEEPVLGPEDGVEFQVGVNICHTNMATHPRDAVYAKRCLFKLNSFTK